MTKAKTEKTLMERLAIHTSNMAQTANYGIEKFDTNREKYGLTYAFEWADDPMASAAKLTAAFQVQAWMETAIKNMPTATGDEQGAEIVKELTRLVIDGGRYPKRSTSPASNAMEQYRLAAFAELLSKLNGSL